MPKPYSQDLRDRVIDAVERGEMSRRAAARRYEISESVAIKWLERFERDGSREAVGHGGHRASKLMPHRDFLQAARTAWWWKQFRETGLRRKIPCLERAAFG